MLGCAILRRVIHDGGYTKRMNKADYVTPTGNPTYAQIDYRILGPRGGAKYRLRK